MLLFELDRSLGIPNTELGCLFVSHKADKDSEAMYIELELEFTPMELMDG